MGNADFATERANSKKWMIRRGAVRLRWPLPFAITDRAIAQALARNDLSYDVRKLLSSSGAPFLSLRGLLFGLKTAVSIPLPRWRAVLFSLIFVYFRSSEITANPHPTPLIGIFGQMRARDLMVHANLLLNSHLKLFRRPI